jgi:quercetin dioxygenase-like cupin family protein
MTGRRRYMAGDPVTLAPHIFKVVVDNDRVRVLEVRAKPGDRSPVHAHPATVTVVMTDCRARSYSPAGDVSEVELHTGQAIYLDAFEHSDEIVGTTEAHLFMVELK